MTNDISYMSPICRQRVGNVSATTSLADIIFDHVGDMSADMLLTIGNMLACWRFQPFFQHLKRRHSQLRLLGVDTMALKEAKKRTEAGIQKKHQLQSIKPTQLQLCQIVTHHPTINVQCISRYLLVKTIFCT